MKTKGELSMKITLIAGSNRTNAASTQLLRYIESLLKARQLTVTFIDLAELPLPLFSPDNQELHPNVRRLLDAIANGDGLILATPEYHGSISGVLKNALDYINAGQVSGKAVLSVSSAGGPLGVSSLSHLQTIVRNLHGINCPEWISIGYGSNAFDPDGVPSDEGMRGRVESAVGNFVDLTRTLTAKAEAVN
jgi:NAD(P)H-dependent FMN reductase